MGALAIANDNMDASKKFLNDNKILPRISFKDGKIHTVKIIKDKEETIPDGRGGTASGIKYLVEENGVQTTIFTSSAGLIAKLAMCESGDVVSIEMKTANNKSFFVVTKDGQKVVDDHEAEGEEEQGTEAPAW